MKKYLIVNKLRDEQTVLSEDLLSDFFRRNGTAAYTVYEIGREVRINLLVSISVVPV